MIFIKLIFSLCLLSLLSACGGGGSDTPANPIDLFSSAKPADITTENSQKLAIAATESASQALSDNNASSLNFKSSSGSTLNTQSFARKLSQQVSQSADLGALCNSGSYNTSGNADSGSITFTNCTLSDAGDFPSGSVVNGTVSITSTDTSFSMEFKNFSVSYNGTTDIINFNMRCTDLDTTFNCTTVSSITGIDGRTYTIGDITVKSNSDSTYDVTAVVVDPDFGKINIDASSVSFNCEAPDSGRPGTGSISFSSNGKFATVTFDSCNSYTVTVDGVASSYNW